VAGLGWGSLTSTTRRVVRSTKVPMALALWVPLMRSPSQWPGNRTLPPKACDHTKVFLKDWERLTRSGRHDLKRLKEAMRLLIANDGPLAPEPKSSSSPVRIARRTITGEVLR